jgi:hypothetical protein
MRVKLCALLLLSGCTGELGTHDRSTDPDTAADASVSDAGRDARIPDSSVRDARVIADARTPPEDTGTPNEQDATTPPPVDAAVVDSATPVDAGVPSSGGKPVFVAVGYRGSRLVSRDLGLTWTESATLMGGGDDNNLLRGAAYANGVFVAAGWNIFTSTDGATWTARTNPTSEWVGGLDYGVPGGAGSGLFVGAGGSGTSIYSSDGINWSAGKPRDGKHTRSLAFGGGKFMGATDNNDWWSTTDGNNWSKDSGGHASNQVVWCTDHFSDHASCNDALAHGRATAFGMGVYVSIVDNPNRLQRSTDGKSWTDVKTIADQNWLEDITFGTVP